MDTMGGEEMAAEFPVASVTPLVSIVIPCFNYAKYLGEAVDSALGQTHHPCEVVVVDDGSTDGSAEVARGYGDRVRYLFQENRGLPATRNSGIQAARGSFIVCLDADDTLAPEFVEKCLNLLLARPDAGFAYTQVRYFGRESGESAYPEYDLDELKKENFVNQSAMMRAEVVKAYPYDESFTKGVEDWNLYLTLAEHGIRGVLLDEPLLNYRKHHDMSSMLDSMSHRGRRSHRLVVKSHPGLYSVSERLSANVKAGVEPIRVAAGRVRRRLNAVPRSSSPNQ